MRAIISILVLAGSLFMACKTSSKNHIEKIITTQRNIMPADSIIQKQKAGVDLFATGNDPVSWALDVDFDKMTSFKATDGINQNILSSFVKKITAETDTYSIKTDLGTMTIQVLNAACAGNNEQFNKKVTVTIKDKTYSGCGKYLFDHQLNDSWELESINNTTQTAAGFAKGLPKMEFNLQTNKMTGSDGCNTISSAIEVKGNRIKFSPFLSTKMACNNNKAEKIFSGLISDKLVDYYMENGKLILYLEDDSKISFKRKSF